MPHTIHTNGDKPKEQKPKIRNFEDFKTWLQRNGLITMLVFGIIAGGWAARMQAEQAAITAESIRLQKSAEIIAQALKDQNDKDESWRDNFQTEFRNFMQLTTDRLARIEEKIN